MVSLRGTRVPLKRYKATKKVQTKTCVSAACNSSTQGCTNRTCVCVRACLILLWSCISSMSWWWTFEGWMLMPQTLKEPNSNPPPSHQPQGSNTSDQTMWGCFYFMLVMSQMSFRPRLRFPSYFPKCIIHGETSRSSVLAFSGHFRTIRRLLMNHCFMVTTWSDKAISHSGQLVSFAYSSVLSVVRQGSIWNTAFICLFTKAISQMLHWSYNTSRVCVVYIQYMYVYMMTYI